MGRPKKENSLSREDVVSAAIACIDQEGETALGVNRVARSLGIKPPAMYKHVKGNEGLKRAVAIAIWQDYLTDFEAQLADLTEPRELMFAGAQATRAYAKEHFARYSVMMSYQLKPTDEVEREIIVRSLQLFRSSLNLGSCREETVVDIMRMIDAAIYGFILKEQSERMTLKRSADKSYEVMLDALLVAVQHIRGSE